MNGLAGQYVLGSVLQPSMFGVLLLVSIERFTAGRTYAAVIWLCVATWFHPTYLLAGAVLCLSYMHLSYERQRDLPTSSQAVPRPDPHPAHCIVQRDLPQ